MKKRLLLSVCCVGITASVMAMERQEAKAGMESLSPDTLRKILSFSGQEFNIHGRAKTVIALAGTNRGLKRALNTGPNMLALIKSLPTKAAGIYLTEKLGGMSGVQSPEVQEWLSQSKLESGEELYMSVDAANPDPEIVRSMVSNSNIDLNWKNSDGMTALMRAGVRGHIEIVKMLVSAGANVNLQDSDGRTALMRADVGGLTCWTAFMRASRCGHTEIVKMLVLAGANVNLQDSDGRTALMRASIRGHADVVKVLVAAGANVNLQDSAGVTALIWASHYGHTEIVKVLVAAGAK